MWLRYKRVPNKIQYPFSSASFEIPRNPFARLKTRLETRRITARERRSKGKANLSPLGTLTELSSDDLPLVFITHNEMTLLPQFLTHYRKLGVTRFICVDDNSTDGGREYLLDQDDVDVWSSLQRFAEARRGRHWREFLFRRYGINRWYLNVDADEFLIYDQYDTQDLKSLIGVLEKHAISRLPAPMLDMYSGDATNQPDGSMPWLISSHLDSEGYTVEAVPRGLSVKGGPRARLFQEQNELMKFPLIYWDDRCYFGSSIHRPTPYQRNFSPIWGALLHFKFFTNYREKILEAATNRQHFGQSKHYIAMAREIEEAGCIKFHTSSSLRFFGSHQLVELGYITRIDFDS